MAPFRGQQEVGDEELGGGPPRGGGGSDAPIGVPDDYTVDTPRGPVAPGRDPDTGRQVGPDMPTTREQKPRYYEGAEWEPARLSPEEIRSIQQAMWDAGLLEPGFRPGVWDPTMASAYRDVLAYANATGITDSQALIQMASAGVVSDEQGRAPLVTQTTNPEDLRRVFRASIISELGQGWDQERINRMVSAYQQAEVSAQQSAYDTELTGGNVTAPPSPEAFAMAEAERADPTGVQVQDIVADYAPLFMQLAASPSWGTSISS